MVSKEQFVEAVRAINKLEEVFSKQKHPYEDLIQEYYDEQHQICKVYTRLKQEDHNGQPIWGIDNIKLDLLE